jgi:hypothetical protein
MSTQTFYFSGKSKWAKLNKPDEKYQNWQINVYLDPDDLTTFASSGLQMTPKNDEEGTFVTFRRPMTKVIKQELVKFEKPEVFDSNGQPLTDLVGNGSHVTVKVLVYDTFKGKGHRLESVRVDNLVKYESNTASAAVTSGSKPVNGLPF